MNIFKIFNVLSGLFTRIRDAGEDGVFTAEEIFEILMGLAGALGWNLRLNTPRYIDSEYTITLTQNKHED